MLSRTQFNHGRAITKSNTVNFPEGPCNAIFVGAAGVVVVVFQDDSTASFTAVVGGYLWVRAKRVNSTGTTAARLVALYQV